MKTITEFSAASIRDAAKIRQELTAAGKTPEELPSAWSEALKERFKLEGEKLDLLMSATESLGEKLEDLKRVVVYTLADGEKLPGSARQQGVHWYLPEYFPPIRGKGKPEAEMKKGRGKGDRDGKKRGGKRRPRKPGNESKEESGFGGRDRNLGKRPQPSGSKGVITPVKPSAPPVPTSNT